MARVHLVEGIECGGWGIEPNVGIVEVSEHSFEIESKRCRGGCFVFIEIVGPSVGKEACHIGCARGHIPSAFEIATSHDCRARIDRLSYGFCGLIVAFDLSKKGIGKLFFIIECSYEFEPFGACEERGFGPLVVKNEIDSTMLQTFGLFVLLIVGRG